MVTVIKKGTTKAKIEEAFEKARKQAKKSFKASKFCGVLKVKDDPLSVQKCLRDEWE